MVAGRDRYAGYRNALKARAASEPDLVVTATSARRAGSARCASCSAAAPASTRLLANDPMAAGALRVLREAGRGVPEDVAVVGFDDAPLALTTDPSLTTVHQSPERMGREMVDLLLDRIAHPEAPPDVRVLPTHLVVRESSG